MFSSLWRYAALLSVASPLPMEKSGSGLSTAIRLINNLAHAKRKKLIFSALIILNLRENVLQIVSR